ncbi:cohesin complex subunit [Coemansia aciculifera]|uniref:Cohesin complex subunit n=1 Tax=Coemansia aciculifera TaxID=417176 RepID=A0A9W8M4J3_9FUNG|nr:cohesin complex subunit [Coemansia aciculifera]
MSGTPQRRSTRATKEPERLAPSTPVTPRKRGKALVSKKTSAFASPVVSSPSKRQRVVAGPSKPKRREISDESSEEEEEEESDEAVSSDDELSDFEESRPAPAATKPTRKKVPGAAPKQRKSKKTSAEVSSQLLDAILDEKTALSQVVSDWIGSYRETGDMAISELINFLIKLTGTSSSSSSSSVTEASLYEDVSETLDELQAQSIAALKRGDTDDDDLLMGKSKEHRRVRKSVLQFLMKLISDGQHHLVFDEVNEESRLSPFIEVLLQWLVSMAGSSYRPFRHVATLVSLSVQTAVVGIRARISVELQTTHRQLETETKRGGRKGVSSRQTQLRERVSQLSVQDEVAEAAFKAFYDTVFIYRYRDVQSAIRSECIVPLATWCRAFPAGYLDTEYLRYLGWALNDKDARVRETALAAIGGPLLLGKQPTHGGVGSGVGAPGASASSEDSVAEGIRPFIGRFLPRIVQVAAGDIDVKVQVAALKLVTLLGKHQFLDATAKIGDIRSIKKGERPGKSSKKKKSSRARGTYSNSLSQQLLEESSSEEEEEEEEEEAGKDVDAGMLDIQTLYGDGCVDSAEEAGQLGCPRHTTMRYLAPLVAHTQAAVRGAAAELVAWWIGEDWARAARVSALGVDRALAHSQTPAAAAAAAAAAADAESDDVDSDASAADLLASAGGRRRVHKWAVFKALAAFLAHLTRGDRQPRGAVKATGEQRVWVAEQSASLVEELWAGAEIGDRVTGLDGMISAAAEEGQAPGRLVAAASALWGRVPELGSLAALAGYLSRDHSASRRAFALSPSEETALLQALGSWAQESAAASPRRSKAAQPDSRWQAALPQLLARNGDHAARVAALAAAASAVDIQALFDADRSDAVEAVAQHLSSALARHAACVRVVRPAAAFLARVDRSAVLRAPWCLPAAEAAACDPARIGALRALMRAADVSSAARLADLLALALAAAEEAVALAALDTALHALMWRGVAADQQMRGGDSRSVLQLAADRDLMLRCCAELADPLASDRLRLRELAAVALGRTLRVFTGALVHSETGRALALSAAEVADIRTRLAALFDQRMSEWMRLRDSGAWHDAPSAWPIAYARVCALAAAWASWLGDQTLPPSALPRLAALTGLAAMEPRSDPPVRRRVGFVALSAVDHIVQAAVDALKPHIMRERTRALAIDALAASLRAAFEVDGDAVNVATLARFVGAALRTAGDMALAPAPVGAAWAAAHALAIPYGLAAGDWETRVAPWFVALSQTVAGVLRPRHAHALGLRLAEAVGALDERAAVAVAAYQKALDKESAKVGAVEARLAQTRAALSPPVSPLPVASRSRSMIRPDDMEIDDDDDDDNDDDGDDDD